MGELIYLQQCKSTQNWNDIIELFHFISKQEQFNFVKNSKNFDFLSQFGTVLFLMFFCFIERQIIVSHSGLSVTTESLKGSPPHFLNPFAYYIFGWVDHDQPSKLRMAAPYQTPLFWEDSKGKIVSSSFMVYCF